jgi:hypothetical protein
MEGRVLGAFFIQRNLVIGLFGWFHSNALSVDLVRIRMVPMLYIVRIRKYAYSGIYLEP